MNVGVFGFELCYSFLSEVGWDEEVLICNEEVWVSFLNEALDGFFKGCRDLTEVSSLGEHLRVELFECALV